jgi:hypothetical protein
MIVRSYDCVLCIHHNTAVVFGVLPNPNSASADSFMPNCKSGSSLSLSLSLSLARKQKQHTSTITPCDGCRKNSKSKNWTREFPPFPVTSGFSCFTNLIFFTSGFSCSTSSRLYFENCAPTCTSYFYIRVINSQLSAHIFFTFVSLCANIMV